MPFPFRPNCLPTALGPALASNGAWHGMSAFATLRMSCRFHSLLVMARIRRCCDAGWFGDLLCWPRSLRSLEIGSSVP